MTARLPRFVAAGLFATAVALGGGLGHAPVVGAAPNWDIEDYDDCMNDIDTNNSVEIIIELIKYCCDHSGGVWQGEQGHTVGQMCAAPAAMGGEGEQTKHPLPPKAPIATATLQPPTVGTPTITKTPIVPTAPLKPPLAG